MFYYLLWLLFFVSPVFGNVNGLTSAESVLERITFSSVVTAVLIFGVVFFVNKLLRLVFNYFSERNAKYRLTLKNLFPIVSFSLYLLALIIVFRSVFDLSGSALIAGVGVVALSFGFGAQSIISNFLSGVLLLGNKPFSVGDKISVGGFYGEVKSVGLFDTRLKTPDDSEVSVPNNLIQVKELVNATGGSLGMLVVVDFFLKHEVDVDLVKKVLWEVAVTSKFCDFHKPVKVVVEESPTTTRFRVKAYVFDQRDEFDFKTDVTTRAKREFKKLRVEYPDFF